MLQNGRGLCTSSSGVSKCWGKYTDCRRYSSTFKITIIFHLWWLSSLLRGLFIKKLLCPLPDNCVIIIFSLDLLKSKVCVVILTFPPHFELSRVLSKNWLFLPQPRVLRAALMQISVEDWSIYPRERLLLPNSSRNTNQCCHLEDTRLYSRPCFHFMLLLWYPHHESPAHHKQLLLCFSCPRFSSVPSATDYIC